MLLLAVLLIEAFRSMYSTETEQTISDKNPSVIAPFFAVVRGSFRVRTPPRGSARVGSMDYCQFSKIACREKWGLRHKLDFVWGLSWYPIQYTVNIL